MQTIIDRVAAARSFVRSLNILLKFARLYGFEHTHTAAQFTAAWAELRNAIPPGDETGLLLGASGAQLLVNGAALEGVPAERSFAKLLSTAGVASIQFLPNVTQDDLARLVRAFPSSNSTSSVLAEQLKAAIAGTVGIRLNEVRFVAEDGATSEIRNAAALTAKALGADANQLKALLSDPQKLLQLIAAAEGSRGDAGALGGGNGGNSGAATAPGGSAAAAGHGGSVPASAHASSAATSLPVSSAGAGRGTSSLAAAPGDEEALTVLRLLARIGQASGSGEGTGPFQQELAKLPHQSRSILQDALATLAARAPNASANEPMLLRLAENLAIRFALDRYERGEVRVNAVREMLDRMSQEITGLRKVLGSHEEKMAQAGVAVESQADVLDRQFWAGVPESGKRGVLTSPDAYCVPPRNIRQYVQELLARDDQATATAILDNYSQTISHEDPAVRRRAAIGLSELAELYGLGDARAMEPAISRTGLQLSAEREAELQALISAAFVRLAQDATMRRHYHAVVQALDSLDGVENQRPIFAQSVRPRLGLEQRLSDFLDEAIRTSPEYPASLVELIARLAHPAAAELVKRFNRSSQRSDRERVVQVAQAVGPEVQSYLRETLQHGKPSDAVESAGMLLRLDPPSVKNRLQIRLPGFPRTAQDRAMRLLAASGAPERGGLLLSLFDQFDPMLQPLTIDEIGMSGDVTAVELLSRIASATGSPNFLRLKAIEALGRLRAMDAEGALREIIEAKKLWHWQHPGELRLAALLALRNIAPEWTAGFYQHSDFSAGDIGLGPSDVPAEEVWSRQRRHLRVRLKSILPATAAS